VGLNHLKEEMIKQWDASLEIQSFEDVLAAPCLPADASFKITLCCRHGGISHLHCNWKIPHSLSSIRIYIYEFKIAVFKMYNELKQLE
jgi:hypothetical protein